MLGMQYIVDELEFNWELFEQKISDDWEKIDLLFKSDFIWKCFLYEGIFLFRIMSFVVEVGVENKDKDLIVQDGELF